MAKAPDDLVDVGPGGYISLEQKRTEQTPAPQEPAAQTAPSDAFAVDPDYVAQQVDLLNPVTQAAAAGAAARPLVKKMIGMDEQTGRQSLETYLKSQIHHKYPGLNLEALEKEIQKIYGPQARVSTMAEVQAALDALKGPVFGQPTVDLSPYTKNIMSQPTTRGKAEMFVKNLGENINPITGQGFGAKTLRTAGRGALGAATGIQGASALNRGLEGDVPGAVVSGVGALGSGLMTSRNPKAKGAGAILQGLSLPAQFMRPEQSVMEEKAKGGRIAKATRDLILPPAENAARTQIIGTLPTYSKAAEILRQQGATGRGIDVGAGLGEGSKILGKNFDTMEPYAKGWNPTYTSASQMPSDAYGQLTNLNVLNVMPRQMRDELVENMGRTMERGGTGIITTRGADVMKAQGRPGPEEMSMITSRDTYQKGFTKQELEDYLRYMLGDQFEVNKLNLGPAGATIKKKAEGGRAVNLQEKKEKSPFSFSMNELKPMPGSETPGMQLPPGVVARLQLEKELEKAKLRAGMSGLAMAVPGKQGVQTIPGAYDVGVNMPVGKGNLDVGAFRSMQPIPDKGYAQGVNVKYTMPFAEGGSTTPAWQRAEGKSPSGGLNALGRASYKRETGGELKPPQPEGGSRKKSFCARMGGMKKKLTSSKTANDPDSRINKALRKWKC